MGLVFLSYVESKSLYGGSHPSGFAYSPQKDCLYIMTNTNLINAVNPLNVQEVRLSSTNIVLPGAESMGDKGIACVRGYLYAISNLGLYKISEDDIWNGRNQWIKVSSSAYFGYGKGMALGTDGLYLYYKDRTQIFKVDTNSGAKTLVVTLASDPSTGNFCGSFHINKNYIACPIGDIGKADIYVFNRSGQQVFTFDSRPPIGNSADKVIGFTRAGKTYMAVTTIWGSMCCGVAEATSSYDSYFKSYAIVSQPPASVIPPSKVRANTQFNVRWDSSPLPSLPQGEVLDDSNVYYKVELYKTNRTKLQEVANLTSLSTPLNAPSSLKEEEEKLFVQVSAGVKQRGAYYYGEPRKSSLFSAYVNNLPTVPPSIIAPTGAFKIGTKVTVSWGASSDADNQVLSYQLDFNDGKGWYTIVNAQTELTFEHTLPAMSDTTQAKYRVRAFDGKDFCEGYRESGVFTIYNNNAPSNPSAFLIPIAGQKVKPLESITVDWGNSIDADNDKITYTIEFFDGVKWTVIGVDLSDSQIVHMIPKIKGTTRAKYRVKATDGKDWSQYTESNEFEVIAMDLDKLATPNALVFDGKDDEIFLGNPPQLNFSKQITIGFKKIKFNKENYEYPIITKMANVNRPAYAVYATPQGHLKLAFGHSSNTNDVLETTEDFSGRWCIIEAFIDTIKGVMGIKVDGKIVASKLIPKGEDIIQCDSPTEVGYDYTTGKYGSFQLSGLYLFNKNLSDDESDNFRGKDLVGNEAELVGCYPFKDGGGATATDITPYKNNATMRGGIRWSFLFAVLSDLRVPYINNPQKKENLEYLRYQANVFRQANGLAIKKWTDDVLREDITPIKAVHINELQSAIREVYTVMSQFFSNPMTEEELKDEVLAHSKKYDIKKLPNRINTILRGLENK